MSKGSGNLQNSGDDEQSSIELISVDTPWILIELDLSGIITKISGQERASELKSSAWIGKSYLEYLDNFLLDPYREQVKQQIIGVLNSAIKKIDFFAELKTNINEYKELLFQVERQDEYPDKIQILLSNINKNNFYRDKISDVKLRSMRVVEYGNIVILRADRDLKITDIIGNSELILGHKKRDLLKRRNVWLELFEKKEVRELFKNLREMGNKPTEISTEIALKKNKNHNAVRWLLLRAVPLFSYDNRFLGWEGFGIDITQKRNNEYELLRQKERIEALYEVAKELHEQNDSAFIALRGLQSLARATNASAGLVAFYQEERDLMEIVAAQGLKSNFLNQVQSFLYNSAKELTNSIQTPGLILEDFEFSQDPFEKLIFEEGLTSALIAPLKSEDLHGKELTLGFIILFRQANNYFRDDDLDIVNIACKQIALVVRQAEYYSAERDQANQLAILYRLSHELSMLMSPRELAEKAFPIIQSQIEIKRLWFGLLHIEESILETHYFYKSSDDSEQLLNINVPLDNLSGLLVKVLKEHEMQIITETDFKKLGLLGDKFLSVNANKLILVPLVALGRAIGVLVVEPTNNEAEIFRRKLSLLRSMANEIATILIARRLEERLADAEKMRLASTLSSGVAHNFNNLLQAVLGQASLIELHAQDNQVITKASKEIIRSAQRGAHLIKQMLSFSESGLSIKEQFELRKFFYELEDMAHTLLSEKIELVYNLGNASLYVMADRNQIQQVVTNLLINAKEAVQKSESPRIDIVASITTITDRELSGQLKNGKYVLIQIKDNGRGMTNEEKERCFEPFFTSKPNNAGGIGFDGAGLGLSFSNSIIKQHGGIISVRSELNMGSTFSIYLPVFEKDTTTDVNIRLDKKVDSKIINTENYSEILIFDDSDQINFQLQEALLDLNVKITKVDSFNDLSKLIEETTARSLIVIFDVQTYEKPDFEILHSKITQINNKHKEIKFFIIGNLTKEDQELFPKESVMEFIHPPLSTGIIRRIIKKNIIVELDQLSKI